VEAVVTDRCGEVGPLFYPGGVQCHWTTIANGRATGSKKQLYWRGYRARSPVVADGTELFPGSGRFRT